MFFRIILFGILLLFSTSGFAQMYRYTDENGNVYFTDDFSRIPPSQQENVKTMPVFQSPPQDHLSDPEIDNTPDEWENDLIKTSKALDQTKAELDSIFSALTEKKAALQAEAPAENASRDEMLAYRDKVLALNAEIDSYQEKREKFEEQVKAFNDRLKR